MNWIPSEISGHWMVAASLVFLVKHFLGDFVLQTSWMARGKDALTGWIMPLLLHAGLHGVMTALIFLWLVPSLGWLGLVDFAVHFCIDRSKSIISRIIRADPMKSPFWWLLGFDQTLHHATHLVFAVLIAGAKVG